MEPQHVTRKLAAILHADVQGYSRLLGEAEEATLRVLGAALARMTTLVEQHGGRAVGSRGDSLLAEFPSVVAAVRCAVAMQRELRGINAELPAERRVEFRMGINLGEIVVEGEHRHGDGINIAVRLEGLAEAGGICLSEVVYEQVRHRLPLQYEAMGEQRLKNIAQPVRVWRVVLEPKDGVSSIETGGPKAQVRGVKAQAKRQKLRRVGTAYRKGAVGAVVGLLFIAGTIGAIRYFSLPIPSLQFPTPSTQPALPLPDKPSIVVLPFVNMSGDPEQEYFSDGLTEDLTSDLATLSGLFVVSRNSAFTYKGKAVKVQDVSKELGVQYVLEGSVRKANDQVRLSVQLIDALQDHHLWAERYDRPLRDIFALQDEVVQRIVTTLQLHLTLVEQGVLARKTTDNLEAYDYYLRGVDYWLRYTKEANVKARQLFEQAIALDPQYADAYTLLGHSYYVAWAWRWTTDPQTLEQMVALAQKALALNNSLPLAHMLLSAVYAQTRQYDQAIAEAERAVALAPNGADLYAGQAEILNVIGRPEDALRSIQQAMRLNPRYPAFYLGMFGQACNWTGRYEEAIAAWKALLLHNPNHMGAYIGLAHSYWQQWIFQLSHDPKTLEQAVAMLQRALALNDSFPDAHALLSYVYLYQKHYEQAVAEMERAVVLDPSNAVFSVMLADILSHAGRTEEATQVLEKVVPPDFPLSLINLGYAYYLLGWTAEAIVPLQKSLTYLPNILEGRLRLAAAYSELGQEAEAQAEAAEVLRLNPAFSLDVWKQRVPYKEEAVVERDYVALRKAGLK